MMNMVRMLRAARHALGFEVVFLGLPLEDWQTLGEAGPIHRGETRADGDANLSGWPQGKLLRPTRRLPPARWVFNGMGESSMRRFRIDPAVSAPVRLAEGGVCGYLYGVADASRPKPSEHDLVTMRDFALRAARDIDAELEVHRLRADREDRIRRVLASGGPAIVYQPVFKLDDLRLIGAQALSRFPSDHSRSPDLWFKDAADVCLQVELELVAIRNALAGFSTVWGKHRIQLSLNASVATIKDERLSLALEGYPRDLIVIELTEHEQVCDYALLLAAIERLRQHGTKIAVDDVGAGYSSMKHILTIRPNILKLDVGLTRSLDSDELRSALVSMLKNFADRFNCSVVSEGVETEDELLILRQLGLQAAQDFLLGGPGSVDALLQDAERDRFACDAVNQHS